MPKSRTLTKSGAAVADREEDVLGLEVAVDDARGVGGGERAADLRGDAQRARHVERALALDHHAELNALEVLHDEVHGAVGRGAGVGDVDDVRVADLGGGARLAPEPLDQVGHPAVARVQHLDRDPLADLDVLGEVDLAHPALADQLVDAVAPIDDLAAEVGTVVGIGGIDRERVGGRAAGPEHHPTLGGGAAIRGAPAIVAEVAAIGGAPADRSRLTHRRARGIAQLVAGRLLDQLAQLVGRRQGQRAGAHARHHRLALGALARDVVGEQLLEERRHAALVGGRRVAGQPGLQRLLHVVAGGVAIGAVRGQRPQADLVELDRHARRPLRRPQHIRILGAGQQILRLLLAGREQLAAGEQLPQHDAGGVHVAAAIELLAARLLRRHVRDLAVDDAGRGLLELERGRRQPEVGELDLAGVGDEDVGRGDVAVNELEIGERVRIGQAAAQLLDDVDRDVDRERDLLLGAAVPHRAQIAALDEVHREEQLAVDLAGVEHGDQVPVRQLHHDLRLVAEAGDVLVVRQVRQHGLDDHQPLEAAIARQRQIKRTHAALSQRPEQVVLPELPRVFIPAIGCGGHGPSLDRGP